MNYTPRISVIIPTYNEEDYIEATLTAVKHQKCNFPYEIIVSDGQSSDRTASIAEKFAKVYISPKKGKAHQMNYVVPKSKGDLLVFLDADTLIKPFFLQKIYHILNKHQKLIACSARVNYFDRKSFSFNLGPHSFTMTPYFILNLSMHIYYFFKSLFGFPELIGCNIIVRRNIFFEAGGFKQPPGKLLGIDKVFSDSLIYLTRKMKHGKIKTLNSVSVLTSGRTLSIHRGLGRVGQYYTKKDLYYDLAKDIEWKN